MKCIHCKGKMKKGTVPFHIDRKGCHLMLESVPVWVCEQCGEAYFEEKEVDAIQDLTHSINEKTQGLLAAG
jgi:YgiT-type zinc finger domain-containing protein